MPKSFLRLGLCLLTPCVAADGAFPLAVGCAESPAGCPNRSTQTLFEEGALAPAAAGTIQCLDTVRAELVHRYKELGTQFRKPPVDKASPVKGLPHAGERPKLPRYTGAGETSIRKAIQQAERFIQEGKSLEAMMLLNELWDDLLRAQEAKQIEPLMDKWNARYPSQLEVDVIGETDLAPYVSYAEALWMAAEPDDPQSDYFWEWVRRSGRADLQSVSELLGYDSLADMLADSIAAERVETVFEVDVAEPLRNLVGGAERLNVIVRGIPRVSRVLDELEDQYPALRDRPWVLRIEPQVESDRDIILPGQKLKLVMPPGGPKGNRGFGPRRGSVWGAPLMIFALFHSLSPWPGILAGITALGLTAYGVLRDPEFFGDTALRRNDAPLLPAA